MSKSKPKKEDSKDVFFENREYLKGISNKERRQALENLEIAKQQEKEKLKSGFRYVTVVGYLGKVSMILKK